MPLAKEFFDNLHKLENVKVHPKMKEFFDTVGMIEKLENEIAGSKNIKTPHVAKLSRQAKALAGKLVESKENIASRTKTQIEYDAVYDCIDYLNNFFYKEK